MTPATDRAELLAHLSGRGIEIGALDSPVEVPPMVGVHPSLLRPKRIWRPSHRHLTASFHLC